MTKSEMFNLAHKSAKVEAARFGIKYNRAFGNAMRGLWAVKKGYRGIEV